MFFITRSKSTGLSTSNADNTKYFEPCNPRSPLSSIYMCLCIFSTHFSYNLNPLSPRQQLVHQPPLHPLQLLLPPALKLQLPVSGAQDFGDAALFRERGEGDFNFGNL